jgi:hypothetical protein
VTVDTDLAAAFRELREEWLQLSRDYATLTAGPYDPDAVEVHLENLRRHRERLRFLRASLHRTAGQPDVH